MRPLARSVRGTLWFALLLLAAPVVAGPVLHERFEPDPVEDLKFGATTPSGKMPATLETRSGMIAAPEESQEAVSPEGQAYGGPHTSSSADANYHLDRLTTRPDRVKYDEPFRPSILPFKRLYAFDRLEPDLSFGVAEDSLVRVSTGGSVEHTEDAFFADFAVDLVGGVPVRIPSVGPGAQIRAFHVDPPQEVEILEDSAENWFVRGTYNARVRMVMQLSIERQVFGSQFRNVAWSSLSPYVSPVPREIADAAREVARHVGVVPGDSPARVVMTLVDYFRRFSESADLPKATDQAELYRELSFEQKGVCRHRAYAFAVTALALGIPTRVVHNEAHAWVEVFDSEIWHRVDLGGAATNVQESRPDPLVVQHRPPSDPYSWPEGAASARELARAVQRQALLGPQNDAGSEPGAAPGQEEPSGARSAKPGADGDSWPGAERSTADAVEGLLSSRDAAEPEVTLRLGEKQLLRGRPLKVMGGASKEGRPCRHSRVDVYVKAQDGLRAIGSVATGEDGNFEGHVTLPPTTPVGRLELFARVAGGCE